MSSTRQLTFLLVLAIVLSGCMGDDGDPVVQEPENTSPPSNAETERPDDPPTPIEDADGAPLNRTLWNFSFDFLGDIVAVGFNLSANTHVSLHDTLHRAGFNGTGVRQTVAAMLLYEPSRGVFFLHSIASGAYPITDHYYHIETPAGAVGGEDRYSFDDRWRSGDDHLNFSLPAGDWTLISYVPGALETRYDLELRFNVPVQVKGPVWGPLGFNFDERAFLGTAAVTTMPAGAMVERHCSIVVDHTFIGRVPINVWGAFQLEIVGPDGTEEYVATDTGTFLRLPDLHEMPKYRVYEPGEWRFNVRAGAGAGVGFAFNLVGADIPLPSDGFVGHYADPERDDGCA